MSSMERSVIMLMFVAFLIFAIYLVYKAVLDARKDPELQAKLKEKEQEKQKKTIKNK